MLNALKSANGRYFPRKITPTSFFLNRASLSYVRTASSLFSNAYSEGSTAVVSDLVGKQALGSCLLRVGDTVVHAAIASSNANSNTCTENALPLSVDYRYRSYANGDLPMHGNSLKERHGTDEEMIVSRIIDRAIRPIFVSGFVDEVQLTLTLHSVDGVNDPITTAINAASIALLQSRLPIVQPFACVRIGYIDGCMVVDPSIASMQTSQLDMIYTATEQGPIMIDLGAQQISENVLFEAMKFAQSKIAEKINFQRNYMRSSSNSDLNVNSVGKVHPFPNELYHQFREKYYDKIMRSMFFEKTFSSDEWLLRSDMALFAASVALQCDGSISLVSQSLAIESLVSVVFRDGICLMQNNGQESVSDIRRFDGRIGLSEIRNQSTFVNNGKAYEKDSENQTDSKFLSIYDGISDIAVLCHRGNSSLLATAALASLSHLKIHQNNNNPSSASYYTNVNTDTSRSDMRKVSAMERERLLMQMDITSNGSDINQSLALSDVNGINATSVMSRHQAGLEAFAKRCLLPVMPKLHDFPYTVRVMMETCNDHRQHENNNFAGQMIDNPSQSGINLATSTSFRGAASLFGALSEANTSAVVSVGAASLALTRIGVPLSEQVAAVSVGLMEGKKKDENNTEVLVLVDSSIIEQRLGDINLRVGGTRQGITALQMEVNPLSRGSANKYPGIPLHWLEQGVEAARTAIGSLVPPSHVESSLINSHHDRPNVLLVELSSELRRTLVTSHKELLQSLQDPRDSPSEVDLELLPKHLYFYDESGLKQAASSSSSAVNQIEKSHIQVPRGSKRLSLVSSLSRWTIPGQVCLGCAVESVKDFGATVILGDGCTTALLHMSDLTHDQGLLRKGVREYLTTDHRVDVVVTHVDPSSGSIRVSRKLLLNPTEPDELNTGGSTVGRVSQVDSNNVAKDSIHVKIDIKTS